MPQGVRQTDDVDLSDNTYDGHEEGTQLKNGLGKLLDGQRGQDNFRTKPTLDKGMFPLILS